MQITHNDTETGATLRVDFDSVAEAVDTLERRTAVKAANQEMLDATERWWSTSKESMCERDRSWLEGALRNGDDDTLRRIEEARARIEERSPTFQRDKPRRVRRRNLDNGDDMDADRFYQRNPMLWERMDRTAKPSRTIVIACEIGVLGFRTRENLLARGAAVVALADYLVKQGFSVEIRAVWYSRSVYARVDGATSLAQVTVKPARTPLDVTAVATALCEVAFARGVILRSRALFAAKQVTKGFGNTTEVPEEMRRVLGIDVSASSDIVTEYEAAAWLDATVARLAGDEAA